MLGHSLGEYVAACLSGVFELDTALTLIAHRGRLVWSLPQGSMLAVAQPASELDLSSFSDISIASINEDGGVVVAGPTQSIKQLADKLNIQSITCTTLQTSHAFHSSMLDPILEEFRHLVQQHKLYAPLIPFVSNVTGTWISAHEAQSADYWVKHLRAPVQFSAGAATLLAETHLVCLEVGPNNSGQSSLHLIQIVCLKTKVCLTPLPKSGPRVYLFRGIGSTNKTSCHVYRYPLTPLNVGGIGLMRRNQVVQIKTTI
jgi:acyl transferase domain-containing protein